MTRNPSYTTPNSHFDALLHGFVDGALEAPVYSEIAERLQDDATAAALADVWNRQNAAMRSAFLKVAQAPAPTYLHTARLEYWREPKAIVSDFSPRQDKPQDAMLAQNQASDESIPNSATISSRKNSFVQILSRVFASPKTHLVGAMLIMFLAGGLGGVGFTNLMSHGLSRYATTITKPLHPAPPQRSHTIIATLNNF